MRWVACLLLLTACRNAPQTVAVDDGVFRAVVIGDSVARGLAASLDQAIEASVVNLGMDGARTFNITGLLAHPRAQAVIRNADLVVISIGGNDLYGDSFARLFSNALPGPQRKRVARNVGVVVANVRRINPEARVFVLGLYNPYRRSSLAAWLDRQVNLWDARLIQQFASEKHVVVTRICDLVDREGRLSTTDHFHPGASGYERIAQRIAAAL